VIPTGAHQIDALRLGLRQKLFRQLLLVHHLISHHSVNGVSHDLLPLDQTKPRSTVKPTYMLV
jgi:hypothetical protein